jgi:hypothetical protein
VTAAGTIAPSPSVQVIVFQAATRLTPSPGHTQPMHETSHGSMSRTQWAFDAPAGTILELNNRKFGVADEGAPMMCNMVCQSMGRHVHIDHCRATADSPCRDAEIQHITTRIPPNPEISKDLITHSLFWRRSGTSLDEDI